MGEWKQSVFLCTVYTIVRSELASIHVADPVVTENGSSVGRRRQLQAKLMKNGASKALAQGLVDLAADIYERHLWRGAAYS